MFAYVVAESTDGTGGVVDQALILTLLENVNQFFRHVGIRFQLEGEIEYVVPPTAGAWNDLSTLALRNEVRSLNQGTGGIEMYFVNQINGGAATGVNNTSQSVNAGILVGMSRILAAKPNGQSAVDRQVSITSATVAHELGHSCGLKDIYTERNGVLLSAEGPLQKEWISEDWGTQSEEIHYYGQELTHPNLIRRLLMFGVRSDNKRDIPVGSVYGLDRNGTDRNVFVGITDPDGGAEIIRSPEHFLRRHEDFDSNSVLFGWATKRRFSNGFEIAGANRCHSPSHYTFRRTRANGAIRSVHKAVWIYSNPDN